MNNKTKVSQNLRDFAVKIDVGHPIGHRDIAHLMRSAAYVIDNFNEGAVILASKIDSGAELKQDDGKWILSSPKNTIASGDSFRDLISDLVMREL